MPGPGVSAYAATKPLMIDTVSADADRVSDYAGKRLQSVIDHPRQQGGEGQMSATERAAGRVAPRRIVAA
jgi:hypothetical protein